MKLTRLEKLKILTAEYDRLVSTNRDLLDNLKVEALGSAISALRDSIVHTLQHNWVESLTDADNVVDKILLEEMLK